MALFAGPKKKISDLPLATPRDQIIRRSRLVFVDDELPPLITDLRNANFAVDHKYDIGPEDVHILERRFYDLLILDYHNVGTRFGSQHGLSLLQHLRRVNPSLVVLAYTSKALGASEAEFFRLADACLPKDALITDSIETIEKALAKSLSPGHLWTQVLSTAGISPGSAADAELQDLLVRGVMQPEKLATLATKLRSIAVSDAARTLAIDIVAKLAELYIKTQLDS